MTIEEKKKKFEEMKRARERAEAEKNASGFTTESAPQFETVCLKPNTSHIIRLVGESLEMRKNDTDPIMVERSLIKDDDGGWFTLIWSEDSDHPMRKLMKTVLGKYKWNPELKTRIYDNAKIPVFKRFMTNNLEGNPFNRGMMPQKYLLINCICRDDDWCKNNKHTKLLCWDYNEVEKDGKTVRYPNYGVKKSLYDKIWNDVCNIRCRHFEDFDILVRRLNQKTKIGDNYLLVNIAEEKSAITKWSQMDGIDYLSKMNDEYLSDEEREYTRYKLVDQPWVSRATPVAMILKRLGKFIKEVDKEFGTSHYEEFVEWKTKELEENKAKSVENEDSSDEEKITTNSICDNVEESVSDDLPSEVEEATVEEKPSITKKVLKKAPFDLSKYISVFPSIERLSDEEKSLIVGWDDNKSIFKFKEGVDMAECPCCAEKGVPCPDGQEGNDIPDEFTVCPYCGVSFE